MDQFEGLNAFLNELERSTKVENKEKTRSVAIYSGDTKNNEYKLLLMPNKNNTYYDANSVTEYEVWFKFFNKKLNKQSQYPLQFLGKESYGELSDAESKLYDEVLDLFNKWSASPNAKNNQGYSACSKRPLVAINAYVISDNKGVEPNYYTLFFRNPKSVVTGINTFIKAKADELGIDEDFKEGGVRKCLENEDFRKVFIGTFSDEVKKRAGLLMFNQVNDKTNYTVNLTYSPNTKLIESTLGKDYDLTEGKEYFKAHSASEIYIGSNVDPTTGKLFNKEHFEKLRDRLKGCLAADIEEAKKGVIDLKTPENNSKEILDEAAAMDQKAKDDLPF